MTDWYVEISGDWITVDPRCAAMFAAAGMRISLGRPEAVIEQRQVTP